MTPGMEYATPNRFGKLPYPMEELPDAIERYTNLGVAHIDYDSYQGYARVRHRNGQDSMFSQNMLHEMYMSYKSWASNKKQQQMNDELNMRANQAYYHGSAGYGGVPYTMTSSGGAAYVVAGTTTTKVTPIEKCDSCGTKGVLHSTRDHHGWCTVKAKSFWTKVKKLHGYRMAKQKLA
jgi:hypothetical protein